MNIEGQLTAHDGQDDDPAGGLRYQTEVANAVNASKAAGADIGPQAELLKSLTSSIGDFQKAIVDLDHAMAHQAAGEPLAHAKHVRDGIIPAMNQVRAGADKLETLVADDLWPLPTYREMLFIK